MIHQTEYVKDLLKRHIERTTSPSELEILLVALDLYSDEEIDEMLDEIKPGIDYEKYRNSDWEAPPYQVLKATIKKASSQKRKELFKKVLANAAIFLCYAIPVLSLVWLVGHHPKLQYSCGALAGNSEIPTGVYSCKLTLNTGCTILIDSTYTGSVAQQGSSEIIKSEPGLLVYKKIVPGQKNDSTQKMYNIITVSKGAQYRIILPDGSKVRLNSASSIRFPVEFSDTARNVELEGEAFFEITPNSGVPFFVKAKNAEIKAPGANFNVNTYTENTIATLLNGSLEIKTPTNTVLLKPGEQAVVNNAGGDKMDNIAKVNHADTSQVVSWKKVRRFYEKMELKDFVTDIGRWYDLQIVSIACVPHGDFSGSFCYDTPLEEVLRSFRRMGLNFKIDGKKIIFCRPG